MNWRIPLGAIVLALLLAALATLWSGGGPAAGPSGPGLERPLTYDTGAPQHFPVIARITLNGANLAPAGGTTTAQWSAPNSYSEGRAVAGSVPAGPDERLQIKATWIEWTTGAAFQAEMDIDWPDRRGTLTLFFDRDGRLAAFTQSSALLDGALGRPAQRDDYRLMGQTCGRALQSSDAALAEFRQLRDADLGVRVADVEAAGRPLPAPNDCTR